MKDLNAAFWKWFGDSKVVDDSGNPLVIYHATYGKFTKFRPMSYFAEDPKYAEFFAHDGHIIPCYLSIQNPLALTILGLKRIPSGELVQFLKHAGIEAGAVDAAFRCHQNGYRDVAWGFIREITANRDLVEPFTKALLKAGFDGIVQEESIGKEAAIVWIPLKPSQIKSAVGNDGTWDIDDEDIRSNPSRDSRSYYDIGHEIGSVLWLWNGRKLEDSTQKKIINQADQDPLYWYKGMPTHGALWDEYGRHWRGRFDPGTGEISIATPNHIPRGEKPPISLLNALESRYGLARITLFNPDRR